VVPSYIGSVREARRSESLDAADWRLPMTMPAAKKTSTVVSGCGVAVVVEASKLGKFDDIIYKSKD